MAETDGRKAKIATYGYIRVSTREQNEDRQLIAMTTLGALKGYTNGTFQPNKPITCAEVTCIVNKMLERSADGDYVDDHPDRINSFTDLNDSYWAYYTIMEATNEHDYSKSRNSEDRSSVSYW